MTNLALERKYQILEESLGDQATFYVEEVQNIFPGLKKSSLYWNLSKLTEEGYIKRIRNGVYAFNEWKGKNAITLSGAAQKIQNMLDETGFNYYISGTDILIRYMLHVPEQYPIIVFIEKSAKEEIQDVLSPDFEILEPAQIKNKYEDLILSGNTRTQVILYVTENFDYAKEGIATVEKAFVDLYFSVTRNNYPVALQELVRMYQNLIRLGIIDKKKMIGAAAKRSIQYDIRFIAESKFITDKAMAFVEILRRDE